MAELYNYAPNRIARGLKLEKTDTIGLIIPDVGNPFFATLAQKIEIQLRSQGFSLILCDTLDETTLEKNLLSLLMHQKVDGMIISPVGLESKHIEETVFGKIPLVLMDRHFPNTRIPFVTSDNYYGGKMAAEYLLSNGHKNIACIQGIRGTVVNTKRLEGFCDALKKNHIHLDDSRIPGNHFSEENGYKETLKLMKLDYPPTAIFTLGNLISLGSVRALNQLKLKIPSDVSLLSYDEQIYSAFLATPMTTIAQNTEEMAKKAVLFLVDQIKSKKTNNYLSIRIKPDIIIRKSVKSLNNSV